MDAQGLHMPDVVICVLPRKMKNLGICVEMGEHVLRILEEYPHIQLIRDDIVFISNKISSYLVHNVAEVFAYIERKKYSHVLLLIPRLAKKAPSHTFYGEIINKLKERNCYVEKIECAV